ncbi:MAG: hypothetical protein HY392_01775 [Candidatus Diapherotrites archaeon]|nr:hypothetical protein [Candidatus Diapherotrites archaeon]
MALGDSMVLELAVHIGELADELKALCLRGFPEQESDLFCRKCLHLSEVLLVEAPFAQKTMGATGENAVFIRENFSGVLNWLLALEYRYLLLARVSGKIRRPWRKKLELGAPGFFRWEMEDG